MFYFLQNKESNHQLLSQRKRRYSFHLWDTPRVLRKLAGMNFFNFRRINFYTAEQTTEYVCFSTDSAIRPPQIHDIATKSLPFTDQA